MGAITPNAFIGKKQRPSDAELSEALGSSREVWDKLIADLAAEHGTGIPEWSCYSPKAGWALRLKRGKRTIVWLAPCKDCFRVMFILGARAVNAARESKLSARVLRMLDAAPKYPEGTGLRLEIKQAKDIPLVMKLAAIKLQN